jgi:hypothetical protein
MATARRYLAGAGTNTAALAFGGFPGPLSCVESYNGSTWTAGGALGTARYCFTGAGASNTAALAFGGNSPNGACTESYNGTSWTAGGAMATARRGLAGAGTNTAALAFGGFSTANVNVACTELWGTNNINLIT